VKWAPSVALGLLMIALAVAVGANSCGVPAETSAHIIAPDDLPFGLSGQAESEDLGQLLPDLAEATEPVTLYFPSENGFVPVARLLSSPVQLVNVVDALAEEPTDATTSYRSAVGPDDVVRIDVRGGKATVTLDQSFLDLPNAEQRVAVAQLVLSLTARPGVGQIDFVVGGTPLQVPRADGTLGKDPVSRDDFSALIRTAAP
jgi:spore germination protein GerM